MPVHFKVIQSICQFPRQFKPAKETVHGAFLCNQALCIHDPKHQSSLRFFQTLNKLLVASFDFLLGLLHG